MILILAWRNIWRNWRRSVITILAVVFATMLAVVQKGVQDGTYDANIKMSVEMMTGYLQIQKSGYMANPSLNKSFRVDSALSRILASTPEIIGWTSRINADGLISFKDQSLGAAIIGIDPEREPRVSKIHTRVTKGEFLGKDRLLDIIVGHTMLKNLKAQIGDTVVILTSGYDGSMGSQKFRISGTFKMGSTEVDAMMAFINLNTANELLTMNSRINAIAISLSGLEQIPEAKQAIKDKLGKRNLDVLDWEELMPDFRQMIEFDNSSNLLYMILLIVVIAFGILNTVLMSITERFREFGIMLSIGLKQSQLVVIVFLETLFITLIGVFIGDIIASIINYWIMLNPIPLGGETAKMYEEYGFMPMIYSTISSAIVIRTSLLVLIIALLTYIYPAYRLFKLEALKGIRYT